MEKRSEAFLRLLNIMDDLREKCPWDKKQTMDTLSYLTIEETYELVDAISDKNLNEIKGELGDLLLHIVFYSKIASETNDFDITDVIHTVCDKLVERHPHIYGDVVAQTEDEVKANWEKIKLKKGKKSVLEGVPRSLPAMVKATRIQEKARGVGFDWEKREQVFEKVLEEFNELEKEIEKTNDKSNIEKEFGDVLFSMINYARFIDIDPELALERTNKKFIGRFNYLEAEVKRLKKNLSEMSLEEMDKIWDESKQQFP
ncbi:MAG: nucleoside triphosphate pyrophosphohydrolase [Bacteroidota bacterium]|nr:nucleoside triphosphate pyrophosphohydrolase [Bacteroidota bacterium]MEC8287054.1 nucleoside triphosphate pyrophosphohydrolase [Bacteroidota bacterium]MED5301784.1 nucleoside triphosphate pyrophosphohydrolase [Bacteroidota bacterium]